MQDSRNVTIYDIAARAGTSPSTVSSVLNGSWEKRRISASRAQAIQQIADDLGFVPNQQARGLRRERSGMIGMILPMHDNRFFSSISQTFEAEARARGLFPIISSTLRDPRLELEAVRQLLAHRAEAIFITGATEPDPLADLCARARVACVNLDLPGHRARSVISDNYAGARDLTLDCIRSHGAPQTALFVGGRAEDHNTRERLRGFDDVVAGAGLRAFEPLAVGYSADLAEAVIDEHLARRGNLPDVLIVNSTIAFEGVVRILRTLPKELLRQTQIGVFDWDPFAALLRLPMRMARQQGDLLVRRAFDLFDADDMAGTEVDMIPVTFSAPPDPQG